MGVPTFYRWLCTKYPKVVKDAIEERERYIDEQWIPADLRDSNPNGIEFDNLYIDMNGVVHNCAHPEDAKQPETQSEMFQNVCEYIDRIVAIVRPRKLLYLAVDGVAPRAKMNQQRARRYKAAAEAQTSEDVYNELAHEWEKEGRPPPIPPKDRWDSNQITPGTEFMEELACVLRFYVSKRIEEDSYWAQLTVLVSDSNVPGEGEHKVMALVRGQRASEKYDPNTKHVMHGMDADLIMLSLATHEPHFYIIRETITDRPQEDSGKKQEQIASSEQNDNSAQSGGIKTNKSFRASWKPLQFLQISVLREYLKAEFTFPCGELCRQDPDTGDLIHVPSDIERHIDDFVMICFFIGNDFLPHLPSLSVQKGSIDQMMTLYRAIYPQLGSYLTDNGILQLPALKMFSSYLAKVEPRIFEEEHRRKINIQRDRDRRQAQEERNAQQARLDPQNQNQGETSQKYRRLEQAKMQPTDTPPGQKKGSMTREHLIDTFKQQLSTKLESHNTNNDMTDPIMLGVGDPGAYRNSYYVNKFHLNDDDDVELYAKRVSAQFVRGMQWVLLYYYKGVQSWSWFFPFHYSPLAMDIYQYGFDVENLGEPDVTFTSFELGQPLTPLQQLMANLPPRSANFLPKCYAQLMTDHLSPIADFYPKRFYEDRDGKRFRWQWVPNLPFIDVGRLLAAAKAVSRDVDPSALKRDSPGDEIIYVSADHPTAKGIGRVLDNNVAEILNIPKAYLAGRYGPATRTITHVRGMPLEVKSEGFDSFVANSLAGSYALPADHDKPQCHLLSGAVVPEAVLTASDKDFEQPTRGRGPFNSQAAKRMILNVVGGAHQQKFLEMERIGRSTYHANIPHHYNAPDCRNVDAERDQGGYRRANSHHPRPPPPQGAYEEKPPMRSRSRYSNDDANQRRDQYPRRENRGNEERYRGHQNNGFESRPQNNSYNSRNQDPYHNGDHRNGNHYQQGEQASRPRHSGGNWNKSGNQGYEHDAPPRRNDGGYNQQAEHRSANLPASLLPRFDPNRQHNHWNDAKREQGQFFTGGSNQFNSNSTRQ